MPEHVLPSVHVPELSHGVEPLPNRVTVDPAEQIAAAPDDAAPPKVPDFDYPFVAEVPALDPPPIDPMIDIA